MDGLKFNQLHFQFKFVVTHSLRILRDTVVNLHSWKNLLSCICLEVSYNLELTTDLFVSTLTFHTPSTELQN